MRVAIIEGLRPGILGARGATKALNEAVAARPDAIVLAGGHSNTTHGLAGAAHAYALASALVPGTIELAAIWTPAEMRCGAGAENEDALEARALLIQSAATFGITLLDQESLILPEFELFGCSSWPTGWTMDCDWLPGDESIWEAKSIKLRRQAEARLRAQLSDAVTADVAVILGQQPSPHLQRFLPRSVYAVQRRINHVQLFESGKDARKAG